MQTFFMRPPNADGRGETLDFDVNFSAWLPDGDTITTATHDLDNEGELVVQAVQVDTPIVKVWVNSDNAVDRATYKITIAASTAGGRVKDVDFKIRIKDQ